MNEPASPSSWSVEPGQWQGARSYQEDDYGYELVEFGTAGETPAMLMVLADGMGGEAGGATASRCVVEAFMHRVREAEVDTETWLEACLDAANRKFGPGWMPIPAWKAWAAQWSQQSMTGRACLG